MHNKYVSYPYEPFFITGSPTSVVFNFVSEEFSFFFEHNSLFWNRYLPVIFDLHAFRCDLWSIKKSQVLQLGLRK